jgi:hypothetical protein
MSPANLYLDENYIDKLIIYAWKHNQVIVIGITIYICRQYKLSKLSKTSLNLVAKARFASEML